MGQIVDEYVVVGKRISGLLFYGIIKLFWNSLFHPLHRIRIGSPPF